MPITQTTAKTCVHCHRIVILEASLWPSTSRLDCQWFCSHCDGLNEARIPRRLFWVRNTVSTLPPGSD